METNRHGDPTDDPDPDPDPDPTTRVSAPLGALKGDTTRAPSELGGPEETVGDKEERLLLRRSLLQQPKASGVL